MTGLALPLISAAGGLSAYLREIRRFPMLEPDEEYMLAKAWREHEDINAAHKLVTSHLRLSAKIAMQHRGYGLPIGDLVQEGNRGLVEALRGFDPEMGNRFATYAMAWIHAAIKEYVLRSWSLVKIGTTAAQKKLFFNLRRIKGEIKALDGGDLAPEQVSEIAERLNVPEHEVVSMNRRLAGRDPSLNTPVADEYGAAEWQDWIEDDRPGQEEALAADEELAQRRALLGHALARLDARERRIFTERRLREDPPTLDSLAREFGISRERVRQIEARAFDRVQAAVREAAAGSVRLPMAARALPPAEPQAPAEAPAE